jgi:pyridoxine 5-phosphate synthase
MARLHVNIDHVATIRQARKHVYPDPVAAAVLAELAGAAGITVHLRGDRRHIQERDLKLLRETVQTKLNVEMAATQDMVRLALNYKPDIVTFVPERPDEVTTEGGLEVSFNKDALGKHVSLLKEADILVSLFIDPDLDQIRAGHNVDADQIEINTAKYTEARDPEEAAKELEKIVNSAKTAAKLGMGVAAGHGLNYNNIGPVARIAEIEEYNIGHAIVARAVLVGLDRAVREMIERISPRG